MLQARQVNSVVAFFVPSRVCVNFMTKMCCFQLNMALFFTLASYKFSMIVNAANFSVCLFGHALNCNLVLFNEQRLHITRQQLLLQLVFDSI